MNHHRKRKLAFLLAVSLLLSLLAGCGKKDNAQQLSANVYVPSYLDLNIDANYISDGCSDGENLYLITQKSEEVKYENPGSTEDAVDVYYSTKYIYEIYRAPWPEARRKSWPITPAPPCPRARTAARA